MKRLTISKHQLSATFHWAPVSLVAIGVLWALRVAFGFNTRELRTALGFSISADVPLWTLLTSALTVATWPGALLTTLALATVGIASERILGSRRYFAFGVLLHVLGVAFGAALAWLLNLVGLYWGLSLHGERMLAPTVWLFGVTAVATAYMNALWKRRIRLFLIVLSVTLLLYAGILVDFALVGAVVVGLVLGGMLNKQPIMKQRPSIRESRILVSTIVGTVFFGPVLSGMNPDAAGPFADTSFLVAPQMTTEHVAMLCEIDPESRHCQHALWMLRASGLGPFVANIMPMLVILVVLYGLSRGRKLAWWAGILAHAGTIGLLVHELDRLQLFDRNLLIAMVQASWVLLPWLLSLGLLVAQRRLFQVRLDTPTRSKFVGVLLIWFLGACATWVIGAILMKSAFRPATILQVLQATPLRFIPPSIARFYSYDLQPITESAWWLSEWVGNVFWLGFLVIFYRALSVDPNPAIASQREQARAMLESGSSDHLGWMTLWPGNSYWFHERGYVAYRIHNSIAVTVGEPVVVGTRERGLGVDTQARTEVAEAFEQHMYARGCQVAWYSVRACFAEERASAGWHSVPVAEESVLIANEPIEFKGKKFQDVRTARNRAGKEGIRTFWTTWDDAGVAIRDQIVALSEEWVADKKLPEMGFTLGGLPELVAPEVKLMIALDEDDRVHGVTSWLPVYEGGEVRGRILDFMRRDTEGFRPVVEYLIAEALLQAHEDGLDWISLSGAPLAVSGEGVLGGVLEKVGATMEPLYGFRSLAAFKRKFIPEHQEWVLAYRDELALPAIGMAVSKCYLPRMDVGQAVHVVRHLRAH